MLLNITLYGVDHHSADVSEREKLAMTQRGMALAYERLLARPGIDGAVILSTCNRMEIYLSASVPADPFALLGFTATPYVKRGEHAFEHLCEVACGVRSQLWGEDQILGQVKDSLLLSRSLHATDSLLEVFFRTAITAAKQVKAKVDMRLPRNTIGHHATALLLEYGVQGPVLVIGSGEIGRLCARLLLEAGYAVYMTRRSRKRGGAPLLGGVTPIDYERRYDILPRCGAVISATKSPHFTLEYSALQRAGKLPPLFIDLAVPRDIEPSVASLGVSCTNIDSFCSEEIARGRVEQRRQMQAIFAQYRLRLCKWLQYQSEVLS